MSLASASLSRISEASPVSVGSTTVSASTEAGRKSTSVGRDELLFHNVRIVSSGIVTFFSTANPLRLVNPWFGISSLEVGTNANLMQWCGLLERSKPGKAQILRDFVWGDPQVKPQFNGRAEDSVVLCVRWIGKRWGGRLWRLSARSVIACGKGLRTRSTVPTTTTLLVPSTRATGPIASFSLVSVMCV